MGNQHTDLITGFVSLDGGVTAVFNEPVEGFKKQMPLLVRNEVCLVGEIVRAVMHDFAAVALDFHGNVIGGFCRSVSIRCPKSRRGVKNGMVVGIFRAGIGMNRGWTGRLVLGEINQNLA